MLFVSSLQLKRHQSGSTGTTLELPKVCRCLSKSRWQMWDFYAMAISFCLSVPLFVCPSSVKFIKLFATRQHLAASGAYRIESDTFVYKTPSLTLVGLRLCKRDVVWRFNLVVTRWLVSIYVVTLRWARLVPGWVTVFGRINCLGMYQPPRSTQPGRPFAGRHNEYHLRLGR